MRYNVEKIKEISDNDEDFIISIVNLFIDEVPSDIKQIEEAIAAENYKLIYQYAHKIKPNVDLMGMKVTLAAVLNLEQHAVAENMQGVEENFAVVKTSVSNTVIDLKTDFNI